CFYLCYSVTARVSAESSTLSLHDALPISSPLSLRSPSTAQPLAKMMSMLPNEQATPNPSKSVKRAWPPSPPPSWTPMANSPPCYPSPAPPTASNLLLMRNSARSSLKQPESSAQGFKPLRMQGVKNSTPIQFLHL